MNKPTVLHFKTNTLLKNLIGKDLINDDNIGIIELVKNSYDAGSSNVVIKFENILNNPKKSRLIIADTGCGMDEEDIKDKWLNVAYSEKKLIDQSQGAFLAGNKGVGRFSCDRLGKNLNMLTRVKNGPINHLAIDWSSFEIEGKKDLTLQEIDVWLEKVSQNKSNDISGEVLDSSGTILVISDLRSQWSEDRLLDLKRDLQKFINPNQLFSNPEFEIELIVEELKEKDKSKDYSNSVNGPVKNLIFDKLSFNSTYIESKSEDLGKSIKTTLYHDGKIVYWVEEENPYFGLLDNISTTIYFLNPYKKAYFKRQTGVRSIDFGSIFLFLNGFRISPYGERGNDWLGLDIRQGQGKNRFFGSRDIIGRIEVIDNNNVLEPISSREGLKETDAFSVIKKDFFLRTLRKLERFVIEGLSWDSVPESIRNEISRDDSLDWNNTEEKYIESEEKKKRRISLSIMSLIGLSKKTLRKFWVNSDLLSELADEKREETKNIISLIEKHDSNFIDNDLKNNLVKISKIINDKEEELKRSKVETENLHKEVFEKDETIDELVKEVEKKDIAITDLETKTESAQAQTLFLKSITSGNRDTKSLLNYHHQICNDAATIDNYIGRALRTLKKSGNINQTINFLEKISKANKKIIATAQYATKANFKAGSKKELTDIPSYIEQYIENVSSYFSASDLKIEISNHVKSIFEINLKRIELSVLIDNLISNSNKAESKNIKITFNLLSTNKLQVSFIDDGNGLSKELDIANAFDLGITTTDGSGLGLYHAKEFMDSIGSDIEVIGEPGEKGVEIKMVFNK
ncbi:ATP-binding protein [Vibrio diabolicus]|uniref:ATP-binding protein n=1 Tax=Vibrio diabolicus TaxID=50719 RepID=UPI00375298D0